MPDVRTCLPLLLRTTPPPSQRRPRPTYPRSFLPDTLLLPSHGAFPRLSSLNIQRRPSPRRLLTLSFEFQRIPSIFSHGLRLPYASHSNQITYCFFIEPMFICYPVKASRSLRGFGVPSCGSMTVTLTKLVVDLLVLRQETTDNRLFWKLLPIIPQDIQADARGRFMRKAKDAS